MRDLVLDLMQSFSAAYFGSLNGLNEVIFINVRLINKSR